MSKSIETVELPAAQSCTTYKDGGSQETQDWWR